MSRSTQFIGLTAKAREFVKDLQEEISDVVVQGMIDDEYLLGRWKAPEFVAHSYHPSYIQEVVQITAHSSGPMIFTCLLVIFKWDDPRCSDDIGHIFEWIHDPTLKEKHLELDQETGSMWV